MYDRVMFPRAQYKACITASVATGILAAMIACAAVADEHTAAEAPSAGSQDSIGTDSDVPLAIYTPPRDISRKRAFYPGWARWQGREGWVRLDFMVDTNGRPYEIAATEWAGDRAFRRAAVRALRKSEFEPATFEGRPVHAGHHLYYHFALKGHVGGRDAVQRYYRALTKAVEKRDRHKADEYLGWLERRGSHNLYEDAYLHVAKSGYYATWGDERQQLTALDRAVGHFTAKRRLPESLYVALQRARFLLLVETKDYQRAVETLETLSETPIDEAVLAPLQAVVDKLESVRLDNTAYSVPGDFGDRFSWNFSLFKDEFYLDAVEGRIEEIKLRCARKFISFRFDPDIQYKINREYMPCRMELIGDPGTTFALTQL